MAFMTKIIDALNSVSTFFYKIYLEVHGWVWPFWQASTFFYELHLLFNTLAWRFNDFSIWVTEVQGKVAQVLSWSTIWNLLLVNVPNLFAIRDWFYGWWATIWNEVGTWWATTKPTVEGWISVATQGLSSLLVAWDNFWGVSWPQWTSNFNNLKLAWDSFWLVTFPTLVSFSWLDIWWDSRLADVDRLINSAFTARETLWTGWDNWRSKIEEFFTDPLDWIKTHVFEPIVDDFNRGFDKGLKGG